MPRLDQQLTPPPPGPLARSAAIRASDKTGMRRRLALAALAGALLAGCAGRAAQPDLGAPRMTFNAVYTADGADLPLRSFLPAGPPRAALVALHGFNDYSNAFSEAGLYFRDRGIALYAYDQRGFGDAPARGRWVGEPLLIDDLRLVVALVRRRNPGVPVFVMGESMGGALAMVAMTAPDPPAADGVILVAPAVRGRATLTPLQRAVLSTVSSVIPWFTVTGQGLGIVPSDNYAMLRQLSHDPLIIHHTRTDTLRGLVDLMDAASEAAPHLTAPTLILAGQRDEIITPIPTCLMLSRLPPRPPGAWRFMLYPRGYHMLLRDRDADLVMADIVRWIDDRAAPLPSGDERLTGTQAATPADITMLPTCSTVTDQLREHPAIAAGR
jgi:acylglycerol lipase